MLQPKFDFTLKIIDLTNVPLICGTAYVKWHLPSSLTAEHRGKTDKAIIRDHKATWEYHKQLSVHAKSILKYYKSTSLDVVEVYIWEM